LIFSSCASTLQIGHRWLFPTPPNPVAPILWLFELLLKHVRMQAEQNVWQHFWIWIMTGAW
jgi:hypothetical protein